VAEQRPEEPPPAKDAGDDGFWTRVQRLFIPGPFAWVAKSGPLKRRFRPGHHMHGLEDHDLPDRPGRFTGTGISDLPRDWGQDPPAR
jgi:hypothetical protein